MSQVAGFAYRLDRRQIEDEIERLICVLDAMDGDADFEEPGDHEPCCEDEGAQCDHEGAMWPT
jgi:hypothetical protein